MTKNHKYKVLNNNQLINMKEMIDVPQGKR